MGAGRPKEAKYEIESMCEIIDAYTDRERIPILKELCYQQYWNYEYVNQLQRGNEELSLSIKRMLNKKEAQLEKFGLCGEINVTMAIFSLKQLGWKDKQELEVKASESERIMEEYLRGCKK